MDVHSPNYNQAIELMTANTALITVELVIISEWLTPEKRRTGSNITKSIGVWVICYTEIGGWDCPSSPSKISVVTGWLWVETHEAHT